MEMRMMEVAHDMKAPLQLIYSCAQMLEMELGADAAAARYVQLLLDSARDLRSMVLAALDDAAGSEGEQLHMETRDIVAEVRHAVQGFMPAAGNKGVKLLFSANIHSFLMNTDALKLRRIAQNLISNALNATPPGGSIEVQLAVRGDAVDLIVSDDGCGISVQNLPFVMQRGFTTGGHGLGLSIVEKFARELSGCVYIDSKQGRGSTFTVHLPVKGAELSV